MLRMTLALAGLCLAAAGAFAAPGDRVTLLNPSFEDAGGALDSYAKEGFQASEGNTLLGIPKGWSAYQWGPNGARFGAAVEKGAGHSGASALRAQNLDAIARGGVYTHANMAAGTYRLSIWARAEKGQTGRARIHLANAYSRPYKVTDQWTQLVFENTVGAATERAEINIQNASGTAGVVWLDDIEIRRVSSVRYVLAPDTRKQRPRTLLFSPMNANYLRDTAKEWGERGFRGFLFDGVMASWPSDVWAVDGDAKTRGDDDGLLKEIRACNDACRRHGVDSNFVKVAFYDELPDWFDDAKWAQVTTNFREGARFARLSGCAGMAIDTEYVSQQFDPGWAGYQKNPRGVEETKRKIQERWRVVTAAMLKEFPRMVLLTLPEGMIYYGDYYLPILQGLLQACADANAPGGLHVMTEGTYHMTQVGALAGAPARIDEIIAEECAKPLRDYWRRRCSVAIGVWPLGYYREIKDAAGKFVGWAGKKEVHGDKIIGSYADKSEWYPVEQFKEQMAGANTFSPRYNWIYGHGCVFWQWTEEQARTYPKCVHKSASNATIPTVPNLAEYFAVIAKPMRAVRTRE